MKLLVVKDTAISDVFLPKGSIIRLYPLEGSKVLRFKIKYTDGTISLQLALYISDEYTFRCLIREGILKVLVKRKSVAKKF
jgi:hypothetical protein